MMGPGEVRDIFEQALDARRQLDRLRQRLADLHGAHHRSPLVGQPSGAGTPGDPTARIGTELADERAGLLRAEQVLSERIERCRSLCDGVSAGLGWDHGVVLADHYLAGKEWGTIARSMGVSRNTVRRMAQTAFEWIANVGPGRAMAGKGNADL